MGIQVYRYGYIGTQAEVLEPLSPRALEPLSPRALEPSESQKRNLELEELGRTRRGTKVRIS